MSHSSLCLSLLLVWYTISLDHTHSVKPSPTKCDILGVHPSECTKYKNNFFYCGGDQKKKLASKYVNDDYCDCVGSGDDEPGTSACSHGRFWCTNVGFRGRFIYSSWVGDGICDCCDGSDETNNEKVKCANTCQEKAREELQDIIQQKKKYMEAIKIRHSLLRIASSKMKEKVSKKAEIEERLQQKQMELKQKEELKNVAQEKESAYKEEKKRKEEEERARKQEEKRKECEAAGGDHCDEIDSEKEEEETEEEEEEKRDEETHERMETDQEETAAERRKRQRRERHERRLARNKERRERRKSRKEAQIETESQEEKEEEEEAPKRHEHTPDEEFPYPEQYRPHEEEVPIETETQPHIHTPDEEFPYPEQYRPHEDEGRERERDDGFDWSEFDEDEDEEEEMYLQYMAEMEEEEKQQEGWEETEEHEEEEVDHVLSELSDRASDARREYNDANREIKNLEKELEEVSNVLNTDFGEKNMFASLLDECYSTKIEKYDYEFCPFGTAKQKDGGSSTDLGSFKQFGVNENKETVMSFEGGLKCWNGPKRSAHVVFVCDTENKLAAVSEPSTCKYAMTFRTPLACRQEELDRLTDLIQNQFKTEL